VLEPIDPSTAGHVLPHEHLYISSVALQVKNKDQRFKEYENAPVTMENLLGIDNEHTFVC
jgi:predicted metal-dependent phosphotriesterase family hydrolase